LKIPLHGQAESLNVAVATGILLYTLIPTENES
jgi:RNA methyltransferase, TrmH family